MARLRLPRSVRIHRSGEIRSLLRRGERRSTPNLVVHFSPSPESSPRIGWIVPKHRHTIVERNRLKRRIREIGRTDVLPALRACAGPDLIIRALPGAYALGFEELRAEIRSVTEWICSRAAC